MGYELFEQLGGALPDVIVYPTGGGTGLVGMWKAFDEMQALGWIGDRAAAAGVACRRRAARRWSRAFDEGADAHRAVAGAADARRRGCACRRRSAASCACGRSARPAAPRSPSPRRTSRPATRALAARSGLDICPEGGAAWAALERCARTRLDQRRRRPSWSSTPGTGLKYR